MEIVGIEEILPITTNSDASFNTDFVLPKGAAGVEVYVITADKTGTPSWTFGLSALTPDGNAVSKITSAAVADSNTTTRVAVLPGVVAVANAIANDVMPGKCRLVATRSAGTYDIKAYAVYYK
jgi:hypothetical protein